MRPKKGPHLILVEESKKVLNVWKNTPGKFGTVLRKLRKILPKNPEAKITFPTMGGDQHISEFESEYAEVRPSGTLKSSKIILLQFHIISLLFKWK